MDECLKVYPITFSLLSFGNYNQKKSENERKRSSSSSNRRRRRQVENGLIYKRKSNFGVLIDSAAQNIFKILHLNVT